MGTGTVQGRLWGSRARDYADYAEAAFLPLCQRVLTETEVGEGTQLLDVGCATGLAAKLAADRGAAVYGLDAAENSIAIARSRVPRGDFRIGDLEELPWADDSFDVVTGFNAFQFAADKVNALRQARRVAKPNGRVAMAVWSRQEECGLAVTMEAIARFFPPPPPGAEGPFSLGAPGRVEQLMDEAGLRPVASGEVECPFVFPNLDTALTAIMSAGIFVAADERAGHAAVREATAESLAQFRTASGSYYQPNRLRYVIATV